MENTIKENESPIIGKNKPRYLKVYKFTIDHREWGELSIQAYSMEEALERAIELKNEYVHLNNGTGGYSGPIPEYGDCYEIIEPFELDSEKTFKSSALLLIFP